MGGRSGLQPPHRSRVTTPTRLLVLLVLARLSLGTDLHYLPNHACDAKLTNPQRNQRTYPYTYCSRNEATEACTKQGCAGLATKAELANAYLPRFGHSNGMCSRGWTTDQGKRWHWLKENKSNKFCNKGYNGNTANCAGAWCKGCPTNLHLCNAAANAAADAPPTLFENYDNSYGNCDADDYGTEAQARAKCDADPSCIAIHDYDCDGTNWRYCTAVTSGGDRKACVYL